MPPDPTTYSSPRILENDTPRWTNLYGKMFRHTPTGDVIKIIDYDPAIDRFECAIWGEFNEWAEARRTISPMEVFRSVWREMGWFARWKWKRYQK